MLYAIVALLVIILDQWTKYWVAGNIALNSGSQDLIPGIVSLVNVHNEGAAFSFLAGANANLYFIIICGVFSVAVIILLATRVIRGELGRWSAVFVMAGGIGNCIDRLLYGYVQDMFKLDFFPQFAIFNVADIFITVFAFLFVLYILFGGNKKRALDEAEFEDEDEEDHLDYKDDEEEEEAPPRKTRRVEKKKDRKSRRIADEDDYDDEEEEEDDEPVAPKKASVKKASAKKPAAEKVKEATPSAPSDYEAEYEAFKAARAARAARQQAVSASVKPAAPVEDDPFASWSRANAAPARPAEPVAPAPGPVAAAKPTASKSSEFDFDLEDILNEFK